jgi:hypothetical protein
MAASALPTWWAPRASSRTEARPHGETTSNRDRRSSPSSMRSATTSASEAPSEPVEYRIVRAEVRAVMARVRGSSQLRMAVPPGGRLSTSSPLAAATPSRSPNISVWAAATDVTTPIVGRATRHSRAMCPGPLAPISNTTASASPGALARVSGKPNSLLNDRGLATVRRPADNAAAAMSLVDVFPTEPVMPATGIGSRRRASLPSRRRATAVSSTTTSGRPRCTGRSTRRAAAPAASAAPAKS